MGMFSFVMGEAEVEKSLWFGGIHAQSCRCFHQTLDRNIWGFGAEMKTPPTSAQFPAIRIVACRMYDRM
jgi:hypothetical protein